MHPLLEKVCEERQFVNDNNEIVSVHSETPASQCMFLQQLILQNGFRHSVEIGLAYGTSTLAIVEAIAKNGGSAVAIDPYENSKWGGNGLQLIRQAGYAESLEFVEDFSYTALSRFLEQGRKFEFAYIDSTKLLDWLMVDFFLLDKLMEPNGIIVFDDLSFPSIRKLLRYLSQLPHYRVCGRYPQNGKLSAIKALMKSLVMKSRRDAMRLMDFRLGIYSRCVALRKVGPDKRHYSWYAPF